MLKMPRRGRKFSEDEEVVWDQPAAPSRPHQLPYNPVWITKKKGIDMYILRMNRDVERMQLQRSLFRLIKDYVLILHLSVDVDLFGNVYGHLVVSSQGDVRDIVKRFQRTSFYGRTMEFSQMNPVVPVPVAFKRAVISIFLEQNKAVLHLVELTRLFEEKYDQPLGLLEILKMGDLVERFTVGETQMIRLLHAAVVWQTNLARQGCLEELPLAYCRMECSHHLEIYLSRCGGRLLTRFYVPLREFSPRVRSLLRHHSDSMNLRSFVTCYEAQFGPLPENEAEGVYLEHLLSCVPDVRIEHLQYQSRKLVLYSEETDSLLTDGHVPELRHFRKEVLNMLIVQRHASIPFGEFVQTYRMHYGKMCRVADFGCTRLFEAMGLLSEDIQVIGLGNGRVITLTHSAQLRRFQRKLSDIQRAYGFPNINSSNFASLYRLVFKQSFIPADYGVCCVEDLLDPLLPSFNFQELPDIRAAFKLDSFRNVSSGFGSEHSYRGGANGSCSDTKRSRICDVSEKEEESPPVSVFTDTSGEFDEGSTSSSGCSEKAEIVQDIKPRSFSNRLAMCFS